MKVTLFVPHGAFLPESALPYLVGSLLRRNGVDVTQLRCNGCLARCMRDSSANWVRDFNFCLNCTGEQRALAKWSGASDVMLGSFLSPSDISESMRWAYSLNGEDLLRAEFRGTNVFSLCEDLFELRYKSVTPTPGNVEQEEFVRQLFITAVHSHVAIERFLARHKPDLMLIASGTDVVGKVMLNLLNKLGLDYAHFEYDSEQSRVFVRPKESGRVLLSSVTIQKLDTLRSDSRSWPAEIVSGIHEILEFLGCSGDAPSATIELTTTTSSDPLRASGINNDPGQGNNRT